MSLTITVNDDLASRLEAKAQAHQRSVEEWALTILGHAVENPDELLNWSRLNQRRFELIQKRYSVGLDESEEQEFVELQDSVAKLLEPHDRQMIEMLKPYEEAAYRLSGTKDG